MDYFRQLFSPRLVPPKVFGGAALLGLVLSLFVPLRFLGAGTGRETGASLGWLVLLVAIAIAAWAALALKAGDTPISPDKPPRALVTGGPYRFSRNPIYLSGALMLFALAFLADSLWLLLAVPVTMFAVQKLAIEPEEARLTEQFGEAYQTYVSAVRRWL